MTDVSTIDFDQAELAFNRLAEIAEAHAFQAGIDEVETVGHLVSYLIDHPMDIEPCLRFGVSELPDDWIFYGSLSYRAISGMIVRPADMRRHRVIKAMERSK